MAYYITCLMSGMIELGSVFWGIKQGYTVEMIIGTALAYQLGNMLRFLVTPRIAKYESLCAGIVLLTSLIIPFLTLKPVGQYIAVIIMFLLFSTVLQNIRSAVQGNIPRWQKRSSRVIGFVLSAFVYLANVQSLIVLAALLFAFSLKTDNHSYGNWFNNWRKGECGQRICWAMVTHQAHYFAYNYLLLIIVMKIVCNPFKAAICFALNWIPYTITEPLIQKLRWNKWKHIAVIAHAFNAIVLCAMFVTITKSVYLTVALWVLTGFGGGNVFCIKRALSEAINYDKNVWSFSEQIGHVLGVCFALIVSLFCPNLRVSMLIAASFAVITIPIILRTIKNKGIQ